jgi:hypothetical protein
MYQRGKAWEGGARRTRGEGKSADIATVRVYCYTFSFGIAFGSPIRMPVGQSEPREDICAAGHELPQELIANTKYLQAVTGVCPSLHIQV